MKKKVLILSYSFPPANVPAANRPYTLARDLNPHLYDVTVLHCSNGISVMGNKGIRDSENEQIKSIAVKAWLSVKSKSDIGTPTKKVGSFSLKAKLKQFITHFLFPDKAIFWYFPVLMYLKKNQSLIENSNIVLTTSPLFTNHLLGLYIKKKNSKIKWIADFRDFHYTFLREFRLVFKLWHKRVEKRVISKADELTFTTPMMMQTYQNRYSAWKSKMYTIPNCSDLSWFEKVNLQSESSQSKKRLTIFYAGSFYNGRRDISTLFRLITETIEDDILKMEDICIEIAGDIDRKTSYVINEYKSVLEIQELGVLSKDEVAQRANQAGILLILVANEPAHSAAVPLKFYEFLMARKPILCFSEKNAQVAQWIDSEKLGWTIPVEYEFEKQYAVFLKMLDSYLFRNRKGVNTNHLLEKYSCKQQAKQFETIFGI